MVLGRWQKIPTDKCRAAIIEHDTIILIIKLGIPQYISNCNMKYRLCGLSQIESSRNLGGITKAANFLRVPSETPLKDLIGVTITFG